MGERASGWGGRRSKSADGPCLLFPPGSYSGCRVERYFARSLPTVGSSSASRTSAMVDGQKRSFGKKGSGSPNKAVEPSLDAEHPEEAFLDTIAATLRDPYPQYQGNQDYR